MTHKTLWAAPVCAWLSVAALATWIAVESKGMRFDPPLQHATATHAADLLQTDGSFLAGIWEP